MKLISCNIEGFGRLKNFKHDFSKGLNVFKQDNGFGKTTLATFIISMLYGEQSKKKDIKSNAKTHYRPWHGGVFGGSLVFEYDGKKYQVTRDFDKKRDDFMLTDVATKRAVDSINGVGVDETNLGDVLFGISKSSYKRCAYVPQDDVISVGVETGLADKLRDAISDTNEKNNFQKALDILDNAAKTIEKSRGSGKLQLIDDKIKEIKDNIASCKTYSNTLMKDRKELTLLDNKLKKIDGQLKDLDNKIQLENQKSNFITQQAYYKEIKQDIANCTEGIGRILPFFKGQDVDAIDLDGIKSRIDKLTQQNKVVGDLKNEVMTERVRLDKIKDDTLHKRERARLLSDQKIIISNENRKLNEENVKLNQQIDDTKKKVNKFNPAIIILFILGVLPGIIALLVSKGGKNKLRDKIANLQQEISNGNNRQQEIAKDIENIDIQIQECNQIEDIDNVALEGILEQVEQQSEVYNEMLQQIDDLFDMFECVGSDSTRRCFEISDNIKEFKNSKDELLKLNARLEAFLSDKDEKKLRDSTVKLVDIDALILDKSNLDSDKIRLIESISELKTNIIRGEDMVVNLEEYENDLSNCNEEKEILLQQKENLLKTKDLLQSANDSLADKYLVPLQNATGELLNKLGIQKSFEFDADYNILISEDNGQRRKLDYYSTGIQELISIGMRLKLVDLIFTSDKSTPCVILDDPFVNLDEEKINLARKFIKEVSKQYQIIYLTCHDSRAVV